MGITERKWTVQDPGDPEKVGRLATELGVDRVLAELLVQRGVETFQQARSFFRPSLDDLHDPFLMKDMDKAVTRLHEAIQKGQKVLVYGDYDVDGTTAVAVVYSYLKPYFKKKKIEFYIPDRYEEGYGISIKGIDYAADNGFKLVIALDCGIKAVERIEYANSRGVDFIICDHHRAGDVIPNAVAVLDAKRPDCHYPYDELSGCGVGFKLVTALSMKGYGTMEEVYELLDLLAVSIAADIVPITGENRVLTYFGLKQLNKNPRPGIEAILQHANIYRREEDKSDDDENVLTRELTVSDLVFLIGPRINASGRMQNGSESVDLLVEQKDEKARKMAEHINHYNEERKELDKRMTEEASNYVEEHPEMKTQSSIVIYNEDWHKGVIGIVASRLTEIYFRPAVVLTRTDDVVTGSARSVSGFDVYKAIQSCSDLLDNFGGHTYAAGLSLSVEKVAAFTERFQAYVDQHIEPEQTRANLEIDAVVNFSDITSRFLADLKRMRPFGPDNPKPVFCSRQVYDYGTSKVVGREQEHIKLELVDNTSSRVMNGIAFGQSSEARYIKTKQAFDIVYTIEENTHRRGEIQLKIEDIKPNDSQNGTLPVHT